MMPPRSEGRSDQLYCNFSVLIDGETRCLRLKQWLRKCTTNYTWIIISLTFPSLHPCPGVLKLTVRTQTTCRVVCPETVTWPYDRPTYKPTNLFSCNYANLSVATKSAPDMKWL